MKKMQIFEPAMCCSTGLCGVGVDPELLRISTVLNSLEKNGFKTDRFNLTDAPMEFINNRKINDFIYANGDEKLPVITLDGEIIIEGRYPSNEEFSRLLDIPDSFLNMDGEEKNEEEVKMDSKSDDCGCSGGCC
ncbi:arsenite efflux transporter metallochaperone ArsD [Alkalibaculum sp. M08DMB]|uniref:Arsenite efflux transporter metallochaperone ArsD n=1 Tax=Alkalibaculum sporogenes TaxID=2655001 RepID=A0A6A7KCR3_9FIRM|nr:arsenite efflux transporter metallochaperone ArsD [Alkalibaculum sporogenes]MPW26793.1 arsenite efflux transporter metallochaperone ArsD [Alkalibaculum sporogenes]